MARSQLRLGIGAGLIAGALWGFAFLAPRINPSYSPSALALGRFSFYALGAVLALFFRSMRKPEELRALLTPGALRASLFFGLIGNSVFYVAVAFSVQVLGVAVAALILGLIPLVVGLLSLKSRADLKQAWFPLLLITLGILLLNYHVLLGEDLAHVSWSLRSQGLGAAFLGLLLWSFFAIWNSAYLKKNPQISGSDWSSSLGLSSFLTLLLLLLAFGRTEDIGLAVDALSAWSEPVALTFLLSNLLLGFGSSWFANFLWNLASQLVPTSLLAQLIVSETLFALIYVYVLEFRLPTLNEGLAALLLMGGVGLAIQRLSLSHAGAETEKGTA